MLLLLEFYFLRLRSPRFLVLVRRVDLRRVLAAVALVHVEALSTWIKHVIGHLVVVVA
jgi:hypothetical protein